MVPCLSGNAFKYPEIGVNLKLKSQYTRWDLFRITKNLLTETKMSVIDLNY
jgi:hypothetical protein